METIPYNRLLLLPPNALHNIRKIHNLDQPKRLAEAIYLLREWLKKQDHIVKKDFSDEYLEKSLISCKGSVEKVKHQLNSSCTMRTMIPRFFAVSNAKTELKELLDLAWLIPLPTVTKDFYRVIMVKVNDKQFTAESFMQFYQYSIIVCEYLKAHDYVNGFIIVHDYSELNVVDLVTKMSVTELQQYVTLIIEGYGARLKGIHILTDSKTIELFVKTLKQLFSKKIGERIFTHPTYEDLHEIIPKEMLPVEYGGTERSIKELQGDWLEAISSDEHVAYMKMMNKACTDESKRLTGKFNEDYLGMPGSFRSLTVD
ncbi:alpha-tocopherol transfer protein-like [Trichoplusia ni]|uniref:Alpha-tocopherol transfer protein-like n=1 Tax=Trichoplusia ni TaxID=7111 RepID=A0A7E5VIJ7_TRINI|nr:alpha-tocopherol transfer protein-like [Trichoplusia ni]